MQTITEKALIEWLTGEGFTVVEFEGSSLWGFTDHANRVVGVDAALLDRQRVPTLLHECYHVRLGHEGHQSAAVEAWINEQVAATLVDPVEYAYWEGQYGWSTGGIAAALELPRWVVDAYRRRLGRIVAGAWPGVEPDGTGRRC